jgi:hypothetical protein
MFRTRSAIGSVLLVLAFAWLGVGCGGGDDSAARLNPSGASDDAATEDADSSDASADDASADDASADDASADDASADSDSGSQSGGGGGDAPQLAQGVWVGSIQFEISGDVDVSEEMPGTGITQGEFSLLTFAAEDGHAGSQIGLGTGSEAGAGVLVSSEKFYGGGEIGKDCTLSMSKNDESGAEGSFSCKGVRGLNGGTDEVVVDIEGTFTLARPE